MYKVLGVPKQGENAEDRNDRLIRRALVPKEPYDIKKNDIRP